MNLRSIRFRLVGWYAGWLTVLYLVFGVFVYQSLDHYLTKSLREALARRTRQVADLVQRAPVEWPQLGHEIQTHFAPEANNRFTRVTINGRTAYVSGPPMDGGFVPMTVPRPVMSGEEEAFIRQIIPGGPVLWVVVLRREGNGNEYVIEEGSAERPIRQTLRAWLVILVLGLGVLILLAVAGGYLLVRQALSPVDRITRAAERITSRNLGERLPVPETRDELQRLSNALNNMIRRLDDAFAHTQRFLADASHELRTPLTIMQAELEAVMERTQNDPDARRIAASAYEEVERLRKIVEGLFALSRLDAGEAMEKSAPFSLGELAGTTADQMRLLAEDSGITLDFRAEPGVVVEGDRARIKQVLVNLLDNAIKFSPPGRPIELRVSQSGTEAVLDVIDHGIGIPAESVPHLFERFYRVDKARSRELGGAGLGLSIVKSICTAHAGSVNVRSREGEGTAFRVSLPLARARVTRA